MTPEGPSRDLMFECDPMFDYPLIEVYWRGDTKYKLLHNRIICKFIMFVQKKGEQFKKLALQYMQYILLSDIYMLSIPEELLMDT